jgi:hypothetical protein
LAWCGDHLQPARPAKHDSRTLEPPYTTQQHASSTLCEQQHWLAAPAAASRPIANSETFLLPLACLHGIWAVLMRLMAKVNQRWCRSFLLLLHQQIQRWWIKS